MRQTGYYRVKVENNNEPEIAEWDSNDWWLCGYPYPFDETVFEWIDDTPIDPNPQSKPESKEWVGVAIPHTDPPVFITPALCLQVEEFAKKERENGINHELTFFRRLFTEPKPEVRKDIADLSPKDMEQRIKSNVAIIEMLVAENFALENETNKQ